MQQKNTGTPNDRVQLMKLMGALAKFRNGFLANVVAQ
jgi:hypothetical protein